MNVNQFFSVKSLLISEIETTFDFFIQLFVYKSNPPIIQINALQIATVNFFALFTYIFLKKATKSSFFNQCMEYAQSFWNFAIVFNFYSNNVSLFKLSVMQRLAIIQKIYIMVSSFQFCPNICHFSNLIYILHQQLGHYRYKQVKNKPNKSNFEIEKS